MSTNKKLAIMQPTYLPWPGYFNLITSSDIFVFLDDAKLEKSSWHVRNQLPINDKASFITLALDASRLDNINEAMLSKDNPWRKKHVGTLRNLYSRSPYGKSFLKPIISIIEDSNINKLSDFNIKIIKEILNYLGVEKEFHLSSELNVEGKRTDRLVNFCKHFDVGTYISPAGAKEYIEEDGNFNNSGYELKFQYAPSKEYSQFNTKEFIPYMSVIDLISNLGKEASLEYIQTLSEYY